MGMPLSWLCLELVHYAIAASVDPDLCFRIRGDDLIALWTTTQWSRYCRLVNSIGLLLNLKKSFRSLTGGVFCEAHYKYVKGTGLVRRPVVSLRFLQRGADTDWLSFGTTLRSFARIGVSLPRLKRLVMPHLAYPLKVCRSIRMDPNLPIEFGGFGLPFGYNKPVRPIDASHIHNVVNGVGTAIPRLIADPGPSTKAVLSMASQVRYVHERTMKPCPHFERAFASLLRYAREVDDLTGHLVGRVSLRQQLKLLVSFRGTEAKPLRGLTYASAYDLLAFLKPSAQSTTQVVGRHGCQ